MVRAAHEVGLTAKMFGGNMIGLLSTTFKTQLGPLLNGIISTAAGTGTGGFAGDGGSAAAAQLAYPQAIALDGAGNLYITDGGNQRIRHGDR